MNPQQPNTPGEKLTVLLIEDDRSFAAIVTNALKESNEFQLFPQIPTTTHEAVRTVKNNLQDIDIMIVDVQLNDNTNGLSAIQQLKKHKIPTVLLTSDEKAMIEVMEFSAEYPHVHSFQSKVTTAFETDFATMLRHHLKFAYDREQAWRQSGKLEVTIGRAKEYLMSEFHRRDYPVPDEAEAYAILTHLCTSGLPKTNKELIKKITSTALTELEKQELIKGRTRKQKREFLEHVCQIIMSKCPTLEELSSTLLWIQDFMNELLPTQKKVRKAMK